MTTIAERGGKVRPKEFHFPVAVEWTGGRRVEAQVEGKPAVEVAPPPVFRGTDPHLWSPEDLLVAAAVSCLAITFTGLAERGHVAYASLRVEGNGIAGAREDGCFGFTWIELHLTVAGDDVEELRRLAEKAEESCLVSASLALPVDVEIDVQRAVGR